MFFFCVLCIVYVRCDVQYTYTRMQNKKIIVAVDDDDDDDGGGICCFCLLVWRYDGAAANVFNALVTLYVIIVILANSAIASILAHTHTRSRAFTH